MQDDIDATRYTAEARIREHIDELVNTMLISESLTTLDSIVYSSCGGDLQLLIAEASIESLCSALGKSPKSLLELATKKDEDHTNGPTGTT